MRPAAKWMKPAAASVHKAASSFREDRAPAVRAAAGSGQGPCALFVPQKTTTRIFRRKQGRRQVFCLRPLACPSKPKSRQAPLGGFPGCIASGGGQSFHGRAQTAMSGGPMGFIKHPPVEHGKRPCGRNLHGRCIGQRRWCGRCAHFYKGTVLCMPKGPCPANAKKMELAFCTFPQNGRTGPRILSCVQSAPASVRPAL